MTAEIAIKARNPLPVARDSVQAQPKFDQFSYSNSWVLQLASIADTFTPWGRSVRVRDAELRAFWPTEPILASAMGRMAQRNANQTIVLDGPPRTVRAVQDMFDNCDFGKGLKKLFIKVSLDYYSQDNGAFIELAGRESENDPVLALNHLDAAWCRRTGRLDEPVIYYDPYNGEQHRLKWYQVLILEEMPAPIRTMLNVQYCVLTRILRAAQVMRDIGVMTAEKAAGRFTKRVTLVSGVSQTFIDDARARAEERADNQGLARFMQPIILASLDPTATPSKVDIDLAELPADFDYDVAMKWYINQLALGFGEDYQTFAPLPGGNLGTSTQSQMLDLKSQGAGPKTWTSDILQAFRSLSVIPKSVQMSFDDRDLREEQLAAQVKSTRAGTRAARIQSGEITVQIARNEAADDGDLKPEYLDVLEQQDANPDITVDDEQDAAAVIDETSDEAALKPSASGQQLALPKPATTPLERPANPPAFIKEALDEVRASRAALMVIKQQADESEEDVKPEVVIAMMKDVLLEGIRLGQSGNSGNNNNTGVQIDRLLLDSLVDLRKEIHQQAAPIVNVPASNVEVMIPEQKEANWQPMAEAIGMAIGDLADALRNQPAPQIIAPVTVNMPRVIAEESEVIRDSDGNMAGATKRYVYEDAA